MEEHRSYHYFAEFSNTEKNQNPGTFHRKGRNGRKGKTKSLRMQGLTAAFSMFSFAPVASFAVKYFFRVRDFQSSPPEV